MVKGLDKAMASMDLEKVLYLHFLKTYGHSRLQGPFFEKSPFGNLHLQNGCQKKIVISVGVHFMLCHCKCDNSTNHQ